MQTYRLTPVRFDSPEWDYSLRREPVQVVADSESDARDLATLRYVIGAKSAGPNLAGKSPWSDARLVQAQRVDHPDPGIPLLDARGLELRDRR
jgi:hypothetical protein